MASLVVHCALGCVAVIFAVHSMLSPAPVAGGAMDTRAMDVRLVLLEPPSAHLEPPPSIPQLRPLPPEIVRQEAPLQTVTAPPPPPASADANLRPVLHSTAPSPAGPTGVAAHEQAPIPANPIDLPAGAVTAFCGVPAIGRSIVFVIDRSATMGLEGRLDRAFRELEASLRRLPQTVRFQVIAYNRSPETLSGTTSRGLVLATAGAIAHAVGRAQHLTAEGGTDHLRALRAALMLEPDVIYFLTDDDELTAAQVREITQLNRRRAAIHTLCFVEPLGSSAMPALARGNRGAFRVVR